MKRLFEFEDCVNHLKNPEPLVRSWALQRLIDVFHNQTAPQVADRLHDQDREIVHHAIHYLRKRNMHQFCPEIMELLKTAEGPLVDSCSLTLGRFKYLPALDTIAEYIDRNHQTESFEWGSLFYFDFVRTKDTFRFLSDLRARVDSKSLLIEINRLLLYKQPEESADYFYNVYAHEPIESDLFREASSALVKELGAMDYLLELEYYSGHIFGDFLETEIARFIPFYEGNGNNFFSKINKLVENGQNLELLQCIHRHSKEIMSDRYSQSLASDEITWLMAQDRTATRIIEKMATKTKPAGSKAKFKKRVAKIAGIGLAIYLSILQRGIYLSAFSPDADTQTLLDLLAGSDAHLPETILDRIVKDEPVDELIAAMTEELLGWKDIHIVKAMGRIRHPLFLPKLIRVLETADEMDIIYDSAISAIQRFSEDTPETILEAIEGKKIADPFDCLSILEHLPYERSFDLAMEVWESQEKDFGLLELINSCLLGICDPRGITFLLDFWEKRLPIVDVEPLETLALLHDQTIPELEEIRAYCVEQRNKRYRLLPPFLDNKPEWDEAEAPLIPVDRPPLATYDWRPPETVRRDDPKIGRNEPCPCGSGKKYKKCCLNKA